MSTVGHNVYRRAGWMIAQQMVKILNVKPVRIMTQDQGDDISIAINIRTAKRIGVYLPAHVIAAADEIYDDFDTELDYDYNR